MRTVLLVDAFSLLPALQARLLKIQAVPSSIDTLCLLWLMNNFISVLMLYAFCPCKAMYIEAFFSLALQIDYLLFKKLSLSAYAFCSSCSVAIVLPFFS